MVSSVSVSSLPYFSYLDQLQGKTAATGNTAATPSTITTTNTGSDSTSSALVSSLLGGNGYSSSVLVSSLLGGNGYSSSVLSLLQGTDGSFDPIATIYGGKSADNGLAKLYANLYDNASASALQQAKLENPKVTASNTTSFSFINDAVKASNAYNATLQQNAASALAQGKAQTQSLIS